MKAKHWIPIIGIFFIFDITDKMRNRKIIPIVYSIYQAISFGGMCCAIAYIMILIAQYFFI